MKSKGIEEPEIGARLNKGILEIIATYGIDALFSEMVEPTPYFKQSESIYNVYLERLNVKNRNKNGLDYKL